MKSLVVIMILIAAAFISFAGCAKADLAIAENTDTQNNNNDNGSNSAGNTKNNQMKIKIGSNYFYCHPL